MKSTKQNSDRENDGNISAEELAYLQKMFRRYTKEDLFSPSYVSNHTRDFRAGYQAGKDSMKMTASGRIVERIKEISAAQQAGKDSLKMTASGRIADRIREMSATQQADKKSLAAVSGRIADITTVLASGFTSLNLNPEMSLTTLLENIDYTASGADALNKDWQNVGNDLWKSWAAIKDEHE